MKEQSKPLEPPTLPSDSAHSALVQRVASSQYFRKAAQLRDLLLYACQLTLAGRPEEINEYQIGCTVLGRGKDFDPSQDSIVRVQAGHLRRRLDEYFAGEGKNEPVVIVVPKGSYVPRFEPRPEPAPAAAVVHEEPAPRRPRDRTAIVGWALALVCLLAAGVYVARSRARPPDRAEPREKSPALWTRMLTSGRRTNIVVADSCLAQMQDILNIDIGLEEYLDRSYPQNLLRNVANPQLRAALELVSYRQYTSLADLNIASRLLQLASRHEARVELRYARHLNIREFKTDNFVIIGSHRSVPWARLFEQRLNFRLEKDSGSGRFYVCNSNVRPGEQATYTNIVQGYTPVETYAVVALLPNLEKTGDVLLLAGATMEASEAAGEFIMSAGLETEWRKIFASAPTGTRQYAEILLRSRPVAGAASNTTVIGYRILPAD